MSYEQAFSPLEQGIAFSHTFETYHPDVFEAFKKRFQGRMIRVDYDEFQNHMPLYLVGSAKNTMMILWLNGDNYRQALAELDLVGEALTVNPDAAGPNTERLGIFFPFADLRQHDRTRKPIPDSAERAIVKAQGITNDVLAKKIKYVASASYVALVDMHNPWESAKWFSKIGLGLINLTTNQLFTSYLVNNGLLTRDLETTVVSADIGDLTNATDLSKKLGRALGREEPLPLAIYLKRRIGYETKRTLVYGEVKGRRAIVGEDMISSGETTDGTISDLLEQGVEEFIYLAPHAVFVEDYYNRLQRLLEIPKVKLIMVSNSLPFVRDGKTVAIPYSRANPKKRLKYWILPIGWQRKPMSF